MAHRAADVHPFTTGIEDMQVLPHLKQAAAVVGERNRTLYAIWSRIANGRKAPRRAELTLRELGRLTSWLITFDVLDGGADFRFRLMGDGLVRFIEDNYAGRLLSEFKTRSFFNTAMGLLSHCVQRAEPVGLGPRIPDFEGKQHWECEYVFLPLSDDGENVTGVIGTMDLWQAGALYAQEDPSAIISSI